MASFTRAGPTSRPLAFPARSGVTRCASGWDPPSGEPYSAFRKSFPKLGSSVPVEVDQGTACLHSLVHWYFTPPSYFSLQVLLPMARCSPSFWQATERLFYVCVSLLLCFANTTRKGYAETLIHFVSSPKAPHLHRRTPQVFPELSDAENYCRNPGGENERPWCYTKDPSVTWEYCSVSPCEDGRQMQCMISATVAVLGTCEVFASWALTASPICSLFCVRPVLGLLRFTQHL